MTAGFMLVLAIFMSSFSEFRLFPWLHEAPQSEFVPEITQ
jgi:hypothetical protein